MLRLPIDTPRLRIRMMRRPDAARLAAYRNLPDIARYQDWSMPYSLAQAEQALQAQHELDGPAAGECVQLAIDHDGEMVGDLALGLVDRVVCMYHCAGSSCWSFSHSAAFGLSPAAFMPAMAC